MFGFAVNLLAIPPSAHRRNAVMPYNFLVASWGGAGHLGPTLTAARQLRASGHGVRFIARADARKVVEAAGFSFASWQREPRFSRSARETIRFR
jgi:UDP:flavonoid glycosyltransferase YjiC (YdhE family)